MVQILNKMVHLKYPILEIPNCLLQGKGWNLTQLQSWGKCSQTIWHHSSAQVILAGKILHPILSVCSSQSNVSSKNSDFWLPLALVTLLKSLLQGSNVAKSWGIHPQVGLSAQHCTSHCYRQNTQSIVCKFWVFVLANQMHACIQNQDFGYTLVMLLLLECLL